MMAEPATTAAGAAFKVIEALLPFGIGSAVSLRFIPGNRWQKVSAFLSGLACAYYLGNGVIAYLGVSPNGLIADSIKFTAGLFALAIVSHALQQIPEVLTDLRRKYLGVAKMLEFLNIVANLIIWAGAGWAALSPRVPTRCGGNMVLGLIAIAALANIVATGRSCASGSAVLMNCAIAVAACWAFWRLQLRGRCCG